MVKCLPEFDYFYCILEKQKINISKIRRSKVTDYAALMKLRFLLQKIKPSQRFLNLQFIQILTLHLHLVQTSLSHFSPCLLIVPSSSLQVRSLLDLDTITLICVHVILL